MTKQAMRRNVLAALAAVSEAERGDWSLSIMGRVLALDAYARAASVFCFAGMAGEPDTRGLIRSMIDEGKRVYLPKPLGAGRMDAVRLLSIDDLRSGMYGLLEPPDGETAVPQSIDLLLVPGAAFDRAGGRLGRGAGFYDRYLACAGGLSVGLAFELQLVDAVPREAHDLPVDRVATERHLYGEDGCS